MQKSISPPGTKVFSQRWRNKSSIQHAALQIDRALLLLFAHRGGEQSQIEREKRKSSLLFVYKQVDEHNKLKGHDDISLYNNVKLKCFLDHKRFVINRRGAASLCTSLAHYKYINRCSVGAAYHVDYLAGGRPSCFACSPCMLYYSGNAPSGPSFPRAASFLQKLIRAQGD
jgi:hypothetical protein